MLAGAVIVVALLGATIGRASAQAGPTSTSLGPLDPYASASREATSPAPAPSRVRRSKLIGGSIGAGAVCSEANCLNVDAFSFGAHVGGFLSERVALVADFWRVAGNEPMPDYEEILVRGRRALHVGAQVWVIPRLWIRVSVGRARISTLFRRQKLYIDSDPVPSVGLAAGFEVWQGPRYAIDVRLRAGAESYGGTRWGAAAVDMAVSWF